MENKEIIQKAIERLNCILNNPQGDIAEDLLEVITLLEEGE